MPSEAALEKLRKAHLLKTSKSPKMSKHGDLILVEKDAVPVPTKTLRAIAAKVRKTGDDLEVYEPGQEDPVKDWVSTGFQEIDDAFSAKTDNKGNRLAGTGQGLPLGKVVEVYGPEAGAKTTLALCIVAQAQKKGLPCGYMDVEHAFEPTYARTLGVNPEAWVYAEPLTGETAIEALIAMIEGGCKVVVLDSVAALMPKAEYEGEIGDKVPAEQARLMSKALRRVVPLAKRHGCLVIFINQIRMKIGIMFGNPEVTSGGNALKFYASVRARVHIKEKIKGKKGKKLGVVIRLEVVKNKIAAPFGEAMFEVRFGRGIRIIEAADEEEEVNP